MVEERRTRVVDLPKVWQGARPRTEGKDEGDREELGQVFTTSAVFELPQRTRMSVQQVGMVIDRRDRKEEGGEGGRTQCLLTIVIQPMATHPF